MVTVQAGKLYRASGCPCDDPAFSGPSGTSRKRLFVSVVLSQECLLG